jgi:hypothetical protein
MSLPSGLAASVGLATEATPGTAQTPDHFIDFNKETLKLGKKTVTGQGLRAGGLYERASRRVVANWAPAGGLDFDAPYSGLGLYLQHMIGGFGTFASCVQQSASAAYLQTITPGPLTGKTGTLQVGKPDSGGTVRPFTYTGVKVADWTLTSELEKIVNLQLNLDAWQELTPDNPQGTSAGPALTSPTYTAGQQFFHFLQGTIYNGGTLSNTGTGPVVTSLASPTAAGYIKKIEIKGTNALDTSRFFFGGTGGSGVPGVKGDQLENGFRKISGSLDVEFSSLTAAYDTYAADTTTTLELLFTGPVIASTFPYMFAVLIPAMKFDGDSPEVAGPGVINTSMPWSGYDGEVYNPIQFMYQSTDTTF